jgi:hypothetical protein
VPEYARFENLGESNDFNDLQSNNSFDDEANTYTMPSKMKTESDFNDFTTNNKDEDVF